jgi:hypothetical protein
MRPREVPNRAQSRRNAQPGWWPGEHLQRRASPFRSLTLRAGVPKGAGGVLRRLPRHEPGLHDAPTPAPLGTSARAHWIASQALSH